MLQTFVKDKRKQDRNSDAWKWWEELTNHPMLWRTKQHRQTEIEQADLLPVYGVAPALH